ncbi:MAG: hypothetical protein ACK4SZ_13165 [Allosphingosinicella sp.]|uniref:hypothetical protein n=1 Tax=Allosphingosinicella sp. TaxID=2823234 RepID=UPI0039295614
MRIRFVAACLVPLGLAGCSEPQDRNVSYGSTTPRYERAPEDSDLLAGNVTPVRVGELGPNFAACNSLGEVRERAVDGAILVRAAPFEPARQTGRLPAGSNFFICSRSLDQRWLGVIYDRNGQASRDCGVSAPIPARRDYEGPCESGWVPSAQVRLVAPVDSSTGEARQNIAELK